MVKFLAARDISPCMDPNGEGKILVAENISPHHLHPKGPIYHTNRASLLATNANICAQFPAPCFDLSLQLG